jgi:hypothetical protein
MQKKTKSRKPHLADDVEFELVVRLAAIAERLLKAIEPFATERGMSVEKAVQQALQAWIHFCPTDEQFHAYSKYADLVTVPCRAVVQEALADYLETAVEAHLEVI